ncbi:hypothetical protein OsI_10810 [Oryza sativa Indica Group]|uniref:IST1-like protein n=1 Tax=Oryza sativa subsp. indica TaxID=39946 RepID=B8AKB4_ORYSI|nr:hypothetical protein OsI_10810 [Oryza sativa Indica Group]
MGFLHRKTSKQTGKLKTLLGLAISRIAAVRRPRLARKSIATDDVRQLLTLGHLDRAIHRAEQVIGEGNMLEAFEMIEIECTEEIREAAAAVMLVAGWCGELPELPFARTILADKFGSDFAEAEKDGTGIVDPMLQRWKNRELTKLDLAVGVEVFWQLNKHGAEEEGDQRDRHGEQHCSGLL